MKAPKILFISLILLVLAGGVSCSAAPQADYAQAVPENIYRVEKEVMADIDENVLLDCYVTEQYIYYRQTEGGGSSLWRQELAEGAEAGRICSFAENETVQTFAVTDAGNVIVAVGNREQGNTELRKIDKRGEIIWTGAFPERQEGLLISHILVGSGGEIYTASQQELFFWSILGKLENCLSVNGELIQHLVEADGGKVAAVQHRQKGQALTVYQGADGKEVFQKDFREEHRWFGDGLYYQEADMLAQYQWDSDSSEAVLSFTDCGIEVSSIRFFRALGENRFLVGYVEEGSPGIRFVWMAADEGQREAEKEEQPKTRLVVASCNPQNLQNSIVRFNRSHEAYVLEAEAFDMDLSVALSELDRFNVYIASDNPPDIIDMPGVGKYHVYARDGYLLDLTPYIEKSDKISLDAFLPRVLEDIAVDGKLYTIPLQIDIHVLACPTELLDGKDSWTIQEYLGLLERYPNALSGDGVSVERVKSDILRKALYLGIDGFVDWEAGKAFLDGEEFRSILERIAGLEVKEISESRKEMAQNGEVVFWDLYPYRTNELLLAEWSGGKELTLIGFPVSGRREGERSLNLIGYSSMLAIHSSSKEAGAAWDCVEEYITGAMNKSNYVFRTGREAFEERIQEDVGVETWTPDGIFPPSTQEQADKVRNAFMEGIYYSADNKPLLDIIEQEARPYFRGEKELEDVVDIIQSRIQVYLNERG